MTPTPPPLLAADALSSALAGLPHWRLEGGTAISRDFVFDDFGIAFGFMTELALQAERQGHHPEWRNVYNRVSISYTTHDAGGLTELDLAAARFADAAHARRRPAVAEAKHGR